MTKITNALIEEKYILQAQNSKFIVGVDVVNHRLRIFNSSGNKEFVFMGSKPEVVLLIADVLKAATKLVKKDINSLCSLQKRAKVLKSK